MLCWSNEDKVIQQRYPVLYPKTETLKDLLVKSSVPVGSNQQPKQDMRYHTTAYLDNRIFDSRLVKDNLLDKWPKEGDPYVERKDYRNLMESYVQNSLKIS